MHLDAGMAMAILDGTDVWPEIPAEYSSGAMGFREGLEPANAAPAEEEEEEEEEKKHDQSPLVKAWRNAHLDLKWGLFLGAANVLVLLLLVAGRRRFVARPVEPLYHGNLYAELAHKEKEMTGRIM